MRKGISIVVSIVFSVLGAGLAIGPASAQVSYSGPPITLRFSAHYPATNHVVRASINPWVQMVEKETGGKILIQLYLGAVLHGARDGFKACVSDITDIAPAYTMYQAGSFHLPHVLDLPFAFTSSAAAGKINEELYPRYFKSEFENMGVYLANYVANGAYNLISKKPVRRVADLKGMKIRSAGGVSSKIIKKLGGVPVPVPANEQYQAFQRGIVDSVLFYDAGIVSYRLHEVGKYLVPIKINVTGSSYAMNRKTFDRFPPDLKKVFYRLQRRFTQLYGEGIDAEDAAARKIMIESGVEVISLAPDELERWKAVLEPIWDEFVAENEPLGLPAKELVKELRSRSQKYASWTPERLMKEVVEHPVPGIISGM